MYEFKDRIRFSETDENLKLTLSALLNYFQDCSLFHSETAGVTVKEMKEEGFAWVLSSWQVELYNMPSFGDEVTTGTFAYDCRGVRGMRNFFMKDSKGKILAEADSLWALIDTKSMRPMRVPAEMQKAYGAGEDKRLELPVLSKHIDTDGEALKSEEISFSSHDCDMNHHVNNVRLIAAALDAAESCGKLIRMRTEFKKQVFGDESLCVCVLKDEKLTRVIFKDSDDNICTVCEFTYE